MNFSQPPSLLTRPDVRRFFSGQLLAEVGSRITREGLPIVAIMAASATAPELGLLAALSVLPSLVVGNAWGYWVDKSRRRPLLVAGSFIRAGILAVVPILYLLHRLDFAAIAVVTVLVAAAGVLLAVARHAYLPFLVTRGRLEDGNQLIGSADAIGETTGPGIMGLLIQGLGAPLAVGFDVLAHVAAGVTLLAIRTREDGPPGDDTGLAGSEPTRQSIVQVWARVARHPILRPLWLNAGLSGIFGGFFSALYELYVLKTLHLSPLWLGILITLGGVGSLGGTWLYRRVRRKLTISAVLAGGYILFAVVNFSVPLAHGAFWTALGFLLAGQFAGDLFATMSQIAATTIEQEVTPDNWLGRVRGTFHALGGGFEVVGALAAGPLALWLSVRGALWIATLGLLCAAPLLIVSRLRTYRADVDSAATLWRP